MIHATDGKWLRSTLCAGLGAVELLVDDDVPPPAATLVVLAIAAALVVTLPLVALVVVAAFAPHCSISSSTASNSNAGAVIAQL